MLGNSGSIKSAGFGTFGIVVAVFAVLVVGLVAWRIYDANSTQSFSSISSQGNNVDNENKSNQVPLVDPNAGYVVIEEWGVRFKPTESLGEVQYFKPKDMTFDSLTFTTKALSETAESCSSHSGNIILGLLYRNKEPAVVYGETLAKIDNYYYQYRGPQAICGAGDDEKESNTLMQLIQSLRTMEAAE